MRKFFLLLPVIFITAMFLSSCQKGISNENVIQPNQEINAKINAWLDSKQSTNEPRNERVEKIRTNLDVSKISIEDLNEGEKFIIVPLKSGFIANTNKEENPINNLLLVMDKTGKVYKGNLVQYIPENRQINSAVPAQTFNKMFNDKKIDVSGRFVVLSIFDKFLYEKIYKDGTLKAFKEVRPENNQPAGVGNREQTETCVDWFRHTTYYYSDGHTETTTEFLYTLCYGTCQPNEMCDQIDGGSGAGGISVDYEYTVSKKLSWDVYNSGAWINYWAISTETKLKGKRVASEPEGGHFINASTEGVSCATCPSHGVAWNYTFDQATYSAQTASHHVIANYTRPGESIQYANKTKNYSFQTVFP